MPSFDCGFIIYRSLATKVKEYRKLKYGLCSEIWRFLMGILEIDKNPFFSIEN